MKRTDWITICIGGLVVAIIVMGLVGCVGMRSSERVLVDTLIDNARVLDDHAVTDDADTQALIEENRRVADQLDEYLTEADEEANDE